MNMKVSNEACENGCPSRQVTANLCIDHCCLYTFIVLALTFCTESVSNGDKDDEKKMMMTITATATRTITEAFEGRRSAKAKLRGKCPSCNAEMHAIYLQYLGLLA